MRKRVFFGEPEIDPAGEHLWLWFWEASAGRQAGMNGPSPLSSSELAAWAQMAGYELRPLEWQILRDMDGAYLKAAYDRREGKAVPQPTQELTTAWFDAVFG